MEYRNLGEIGLKVGAIGLGTEHLNKQPQKTVISVIHRAVDHGVNYIDLPFNFPSFLDNIGTALKGVRDEVIITSHLGSAERKGQYRKTRSVRECEKLFSDALDRLNTTYVDVANVHFVKSRKQWEEVKVKGIVDLALRLKQEGRARFVGISTHDPSVAMEAAQGSMDVVMIQVNVANNAMPQRNEMLGTCAKEGAGVVAMKPFAGGKLLQQNRTVSIAAYQSGWKSLKKKIPSVITPIQCISYTLSQVGVSTVVPGVKNTEELNGVLAFLDATEEEKDFSGLLSEFEEYVTGECVYCNHCLPCPSGIEIGEIIRLLDTGQQGVTKDIQKKYDALSAKASDCIECDACTERCPFAVDVLSKMNHAVALFEKKL